MISLLESKNAVLRKGAAYFSQLPRWAVRAVVVRRDYCDHPPILVNSIPKSGTYLLMQLARAVFGARYYGSFVAQAWSVTLHPRTRDQILFRLKYLVPGEVVGAHLHHDADVARFLKELPAIHLFIYRDPRDVILSEAFYLAEMNRWHRLHRMFKAIPDEETRVRTLIEGIPGLYADIGTRLRAYLGWLNEPQTIAVRYEDLMGDARAHTIHALAERICARTTRLNDPDTLAKRMARAIVPARSHTFREGGSDKWRRRMSPENQARIEKLAGTEIAHLGYSLSHEPRGAMYAAQRCS